MNDQTVRDLLHEAADDVEPRDRLDAIRAATASTSGARRTHRGWWAAGGGAGLLAASIATAFALTGGVPQTEGPRPADDPSVSPTLPTTEPTDSPAQSNVVAVYFVSDTSSGPRLFREFRPRRNPGKPAQYALNAAVQGTAVDPDYRSAWPAGVTVHDTDRTREGIVLSLSDVPPDRPAGMSAGDARLAVEAAGPHRAGRVRHGQAPRPGAGRRSRSPTRSSVCRSPSR